MIHTSSLVTDDWDAIVARLGGAEALETGARLTGAFLRPRKIRSAVDLLRFTLAYCLGEMGLRLTAAWGAALGSADVSNVAVPRPFELRDQHRLLELGDRAQHLPDQHSV